MLRMIDTKTHLTNNFKSEACYAIILDFTNKNTCIPTCSWQTEIPGLIKFWKWLAPPPPHQKKIKKKPKNKKNGLTKQNKIGKLSSPCSQRDPVHPAAHPLSHWPDTRLQVLSSLQCPLHRWLQPDPYHPNSHSEKKKQQGKSASWLLAN